MRSNRYLARPQNTRAGRGLCSARMGRDVCSARVPQLATALGRCQRGLSERGTNFPAPAAALNAPPDAPRSRRVSARGLGLCPGAVPPALNAPPDAPAQSAVQRAWAGVFVQREFRSRQRPLTPPQTPRAVAELARGALGFVQREFRSWLWLIATTSEDCLSEEQSPLPQPRRYADSAVSKMWPILLAFTSR